MRFVNKRGLKVSNEPEIDDETDDEQAACEHVWVFKKDWMGDRSIPNGTCDCSYWECKKCDETTEYRPDGWDDPRELAADEAYDRWKDDQLTGWGK